MAGFFLLRLDGMSVFLLISLQKMFLLEGVQMNLLFLEHHRNYLYLNIFSNCPFMSTLVPVNCFCFIF